MVGVVPWRTSSTRVGGGAWRRPAARPALEWSPCRLTNLPCLGHGAPAVRAGDSLERLAAEIVACRACPRLVAWREEVAADTAGRVP